MSTHSMSDDEFFFGYLADYLDGHLSKANATKFESLLSSPTRQRQLDLFQNMRGKLQVLASHYLVDKGQRAKIRDFIQDAEVRDTMEAVHISLLAQKELLNRILRRMVFGTLILAFIGAVVYVLWPMSDPKFDLLENIRFESIALMEDPENRLDLETSDINEIKQFINSVKGLSFKPNILTPSDKNWEPTGCSVIDYEITKIISVQYVNKNNPQEKIVHFEAASRMEDLPKSEKGNLNGFVYQTYTDERINMVAWEASPNSIGILVGSKGAAELAEFAQRSTEPRN